MSSLSLKHIFKVYDKTVRAVSDFSMEIADGEFIVFVGPSGCGKSTTLRMIAGLEDITSGRLSIDGRVVNSLEPSERGVAMVFQNYALYPHMSVYENMAFPLRTAHMPRDEIDRRVKNAAELLGITEYLSRRPKALSGGQRQRVALGRAIVRDPKVFLLDEPLSNLDAKLRAAMRAEITALHERLGTTFVYVTHDQVEAMTMGDRIVVMKDGVVMQIDSPMDLYRHPENRFVASFIGSPPMNFLDVSVKRVGEMLKFTTAGGDSLEFPYRALDRLPATCLDGKHKLTLGIRPEHFVINHEGGKGISAAVTHVEALGGESLVHAVLSSGENVTVKCDSDEQFCRGEGISLSVDARFVHIFDTKSGETLLRRLPHDNRISAEIVDDRLHFGGQSLPLPPALCGRVGRGELTLPTDAITIGGEGSGTLVRTENVGEHRFAVLDVGENTLFAEISDEKRLFEGENIGFSIDMRMISMPDVGIFPLERKNRFFGRLIKKKGEFFFSIGKSLQKAPMELCRTLFEAAESDIFRIPLEFVFDEEGVRIVPSSPETLVCTVTGLLDYGAHKYITAEHEGTNLTLPYEGATHIGDTIAVALDFEHAAVIDREREIIIG